MLQTLLQIELIAAQRPNLEELRIFPNRHAIRRVLEAMDDAEDRDREEDSDYGSDVENDRLERQAVLHDNARLRQAALNIMGPLMPRGP